MECRSFIIKTTKSLLHIHDDVIAQVQTYTALFRFYTLDSIRLANEGIRRYILTSY